MRFNIGNKVIVKTENGSERRGTILALGHNQDVKIGVGEPHYYNYHEKWFASNKVLAFHELPYEEAEKTWQTELPHAFEYAKKVFAKSLPDSILEFDGEMIRDNRSGFYITGVIIERRTIGSVMEIAGYGVFAEQVVPGIRTFSNGDPGYPDDVECVEFGTHSTYQSAVIVMVKEVFASNLQASIEFESEQELAKLYMDDTN